MAHFVDYTRARRFIEEHGHPVHVTKEGLLAITWCRDAAATGRGDDTWCEEPAVFPIRDDNMVNATAIREWLGY